MPADAWVLDAVTKRFGGLIALDRISLRLAPGTFLLLAGDNGAGKSTLLRLLAGLCRPSEGRVLVGGDPPHRSAKARSRIGLLSHHSLLYDDLSAGENLLFCARLYGLAAPGRRVEEGLQEVGLQRRKDQRVGTFSRGMKQRLSLARALLHRPDVLLLDEPYTGLDVTAAAELSQRLARIEATTVMVTHHVEEAAGLANHLALLKGGRLCHQQPWEGGDARQLRALYTRYLTSGP